jgi:hypothetical protein
MMMMLCCLIGYELQCFICCVPFFFYAGFLGLMMDVIHSTIINQSSLFLAMKTYSYLDNYLVMSHHMYVLQKLLKRVLSLNVK